MEMTIRELIMHQAQLKETDIIEINAKKVNELCSEEHISIETKVSSDIINDKEGYSYIQVMLIPEGGDFSLSVTVRGRFEIETPLDQSAFERFLLAQGVKILWSYVREVIYDLTGRMLRSAFLLPTLDVVQTLAKTKINKDVTYDENSYSEQD